ncbi:MAG TPA: tRNA uridine-5-carboxymethylaminomethyl(34) synthesis GTPase MnmE [Nevskiaceae bacterium]
MATADGTSSSRGAAINDTIAAIATPPGRGAVGIVRLSGPEAVAIAECMTGALPPPRTVALRGFRDAAGVVVDHGLVLYFKAPHSYTGEDVVELQGHGGTVVTGMVLAAALAAGARQARPGEFSQRAYLNDRMDLAQAEAVADLIDAATRSAARAAERSLQGVFSRRVEALQRALIEVRVRVEGALDFSEEEAGWFGAELQWAMEQARDELEALLAAGTQGRRLTEGYTVAIAGQPNVGKSTLMNRLAGTDAAIVTAIPGTTRDVLRESLDLDGLPVTLVDTAGLRDSDDPIEREGILRATHAFTRCELILYLVDAREGVTATDRTLMATLPPAVRHLVILNKADLLGERPLPDGAPLAISAADGRGIAQLVRAIRESAGVEDAPAAFSTRSRHLDALRRTHDHLELAWGYLRDGDAAELAAEELRAAHRSLGEICGELDSEELLGRIFAGFCIGK